MCIRDRLCRLYGEEMRRRGEGYILVMSSATAWMPYPTIAAYAATKSFLRTFARSLNFEFRKYGVRVTGVFPGAVDTPLYDLDAACRRRLLRGGVMSAPQEVAQHGLRALFRGRGSCIPGVFTKICVCVCRLVPAWLMRCVPVSYTHLDVYKRQRTACSATWPSRCWRP